MSSALEERLAQIEQMTTNKDVGKVMLGCWRDLRLGRITAEECDVFVRAAKRRLSAIKKEMRTKDPHKRPHTRACR